MKKIGKTKKFNPESLKKLEFKDTAPNDQFKKRKNKNKEFNPYLLTFTVYFLVTLPQVA